MDAYDKDEFIAILNGSDRGWFDHTGSCGGCGDDADECHPGHPCGDVPGYDHGVCDLCQTRVETGEIREVRTP